MDGWMDGWMDGRMDEWVGGWMDGWMDGWVDDRNYGDVHRYTDILLVWVVDRWIIFYFNGHLWSIPTE